MMIMMIDHHHHHYHCDSTRRRVVVFFTPIRKVLVLIRIIWCVVVVAYYYHHSIITPTIVHAVTVRYRQGRLLVHAIQEVSLLKDSSNSTNDTKATTLLWEKHQTENNINVRSIDTVIVINNISIAKARQYCQEHLDCVSFGFETSSLSSLSLTSSSSLRFPTFVNIRAYFYPFADWHVISTTTIATNNTVDGLQPQETTFQSAFVQDDMNWHLYINTTREIEIIPHEMKFILDTLDSLNNDDNNGPCRRRRHHRDTTTKDATMEKLQQTVVDDSSLSSSFKQQQLRSSLRSSSIKSIGGGGGGGDDDDGIQQDDATAQRQQKEQENEQLRLVEQEECIIQLKIDLMNAIYPIVSRDELVATVAPYLILKLLQLAYHDDNSNNNTSTTTTTTTTTTSSFQHQQQHVEVRKSAIVNLIVIANSRETAPILVQAGIFHIMQRIIQNELDKTSNDHDRWDGLPILALDVISNIALHQTANAQLQQQGAKEFLHKIVHDEPQGSFPALQALLALLHMTGGGVGGDVGDVISANDDHGKSRKDNHFSLPQSTVVELVNLLQSSIDGDIVYGIIWDLIPGPLSAIQLLIQQQQQQGTATSLDDSSSSSSTIIDELLNAGLVEQLVRILEASCLVAPHVEASIEILHTLSQLSHHHHRAREMIVLMAANPIRLVQERLQQYQKPARLAQELQMIVSHHDFVDSSLLYSGLSEEL